MCAEGDAEAMREARGLREGQSSRWRVREGECENGGAGEGRAQKGGRDEGQVGRLGNSNDQFANDRRKSRGDGRGEAGIRTGLLRAGRRGEKIGEGRSRWQEARGKGNGGAEAEVAGNLGRGNHMARSMERAGRPSLASGRDGWGEGQARTEVAARPPWCHEGIRDAGADERGEPFGACCLRPDEWKWLGRVTSQGACLSAGGC